MPEPKKPLNRYILWATAISVTASAIIGTMHAAGIMEPYWLATRSYTRYAILSSELRMMEFARDNLQNQIDALELQAKKPDNASEVSQSSLSEHLAQQRTKLRAIENQIRDLSRQQSNLR